MPDKMLVREQQFLVPGNSKVTFFLCPYGSQIWMFKWTIKRLQKEGYSVVAYDFNSQIWQTGDPQLLPLVITQTRQLIKAAVGSLKKSGYTEFGFIGSSLGAFVIYNCIGYVPEFSWGIMNTGGEAASAVWRFPKLRQAFEAQGHSLEELRQLWQPLQYPKLGQQQGKRFAVVSSHGDKLTPWMEAREAFEHIALSGATTQVIMRKRLGHVPTVLTTLLRIRKIVAEVTTTPSGTIETQSHK